MLLLLRDASQAERARWSRAIRSGEDIQALIEATRSSGALASAIHTALTHLREAGQALEIVPQTPYRNGLQDLCKSVDRLLKQFV